MAIEFTCPACGGALRVRDAAAGQVVRCGGCLTLLRVPEVEPTPTPQPAFPGGEPELPPRSVPRPAPPQPPAAAAEPDFPDPGQTPPRPVRDTRFWLMVTGATLMLGTCGCCGLAALILPDPEWRSHESRAGGFRVELPAAPRKDMERRFRDQGLRLQRMKAAEGAHLWTRAENYLVAYRDLSDARDFRRPPDQILDDEVKSLLGGDARRAARAERIEVGGFPGREFEYHADGGAVYTGRVILAGARLYVLLAGGRFTEPDDANVRRFLESFEITAPNLLAEAKRRADAAALEEEESRLRELGEVAAAAALAAVEAAMEQKP